MKFKIETNISSNIQEPYITINAPEFTEEIQDVINYNKYPKIHDDIFYKLSFFYIYYILLYFFLYTLLNFNRYRYWYIVWIIYANKNANAMANAP